MATDSRVTEFMLTGFSQSVGFRIFTFERVAEDRSRIAFTVKADLAVARRNNIPLQELPLLCREVLFRKVAQDHMIRAFTFSEEDMLLLSTTRATARASAALKRKPPRRPANDQLGAAWRLPVR